MSSYRSQNCCKKNSQTDIKSEISNNDISYGITGNLSCDRRGLRKAGARYNSKIDNDTSIRTSLSHDRYGGFNADTEFDHNIDSVNAITGNIGYNQSRGCNGGVGIKHSIEKDADITFSTSVDNRGKDFSFVCSVPVGGSCNIF